MGGVRLLTLYERAKEALVGGVNSPVRAFKGVNLPPLMAQRGKGAYLWDIEGRKYIDYILGWGPLILGHAHEEVVEEIKKVLSRGTLWGLTQEYEIYLAEKIKEAFPFVDKVRLVNSGTEASLSAIRLARAYTSKRKVLKFIGNYHGHVDYLLAQAGSGVLTYEASTPGIPESYLQETLLMEYNEDKEKIREVVERYHEELACIILEPIAGNMGVVLPREGFLSFLRDLTYRYKILLIFDEVITGFRVSWGGVSKEEGIEPDLILLGKVVGGGFPIGAFAGKKEIMDLLAPEGKVYQAGTLAGNPISTAGGWKTLEILQRENPYPKIEERLKEFLKEIQEFFLKKGIPISTPYKVSFFSIFFCEKEPKNLQDVLASDTKLFQKFYRHLLEGGVLFPPSPFEACFLSIYHQEEELEKTLKRIKEFSP